VLESIAEQDIHDISLTQIIGDLAGAATGTSGDLFTPAMEDVEAENDSSDRAAALSDRVKKIIKVLLEKLYALAKWIYAKFKQLVASMKAGLQKLRQMAGKKIDAARARAIRKKCAMMNDTAKALEDFIPLMADLANLRIQAAEEPAGSSEEGLDLNILNNMDRCIRDMEIFAKKYDTERYIGNIKFTVNVDRLDRQSAQAAVLTFGQCYFDITRSSAASDALNEAVEGEDGGSPDALINELEAVSNSYARFLGEYGALSLSTLIKAVEKKIKHFESKVGVSTIFFSTPGKVGPTATKVLNMSTLAMARDVSALTKVSSYVTVDAAALNGMLSSLVNIDESEAVPA
jgi:hypothetical protein